MESGTVVLLIGLPASGKSSLATDIIKYFNHNSQQERSNQICFYLIKFDDLISVDQQIELIKQPFKWKQARRNFLQASEAFLNLILNLPTPSLNHQTNQLLKKIVKKNLIDSNSQKFVLVVEDNFYYRSMRQPFYRASKKRSLGFGVIMIKTDLAECLKRNNLRGDNHVSDEVIFKMEQVFEEPNSDQISTVDNKSILINTNKKVDLKLIENFIYDLIHNPLKEDSLKRMEEKGRDRLINDLNLAHQFDSFLRMVVRVLMKKNEENSQLITESGQQLAMIKRRLIARFKHDSTIIPSWLSRELVDGDKRSQRALQFGLSLFKAKMLNDVDN